MRNPPPRRASATILLALVPPPPLRLLLMAAALLATLSFLALRPAGAAYPWSVPLEASGPIDVGNQSNVVIENKRISNPSGSCILVYGSSSVTIRNSVIGPCGDHAIRSHDNSNVTISGVLVREVNGIGLLLWQSNNIEVKDSHFEDVATGVNALRSSGVNVHHNAFRNMRGTKSTFVQFDKVSGSGNRVNHNVAENVAGAGDPEDGISLYKTHGTSGSPVEIIGNRLRGGGPSRSSAGIQTGDGREGSYAVVRDNILVNTGAVGIGVSGGNNIRVLNNTVFGRSQEFTNVGIYVWDWVSEGNCRDHEVRGNRVLWHNRDGNLASSWDGRNCGPVDGWSENDWSAGLSEGSFGDVSVASISLSNFEPTTPADPDGDGDGYPASTDCDDGNASINPGATEQLGNGIDDDCNPSTVDDPDADGDGYTVVAGNDCDDNAPLVHPGMTEKVGNGADDDCNGSTPDDPNAGGGSFLNVNVSMLDRSGSGVGDGTISLRIEDASTGKSWILDGQVDGGGNVTLRVGN